MAVETLTVTLGVDDSGGRVNGSALVSGDNDDNQIVTVEDGGDLSGNYLFERWGKDAATESGAGAGGDDTFTLDLANFDDDFTISVKSMDANDTFNLYNYDSVATDGTITTFTYTGTDGFLHTVSIDAESCNGTGTVNVVVCFAGGTLIRTKDGEIPIETLQAGDPVICSDGVTRPIIWIGSRKVDSATLNLYPELRPIQIAADAIKLGQPHADLRVSPQHRILLRDWRAELLFGEAEVLAPAVTLVNDHNIRVDTECKEVEYFHILLDSHNTILANGLECETLMPNDAANTALSAESRAEIFKLFPELVGDMASYGKLCFQTLKSYEARLMHSIE